MIIVTKMSIYKKQDDEKAPKPKKLQKEFGFNTRGQMERYRKILKRQQEKELGCEVEIYFETKEI